MKYENVCCRNCRYIEHHNFNDICFASGTRIDDLGSCCPLFHRKESGRQAVLNV